MLRLLIPTGSGYTWSNTRHPRHFPTNSSGRTCSNQPPTKSARSKAAHGRRADTRGDEGIETSNRLYEEGGAIYMTATVGSKLDSERPESSAITFILSNGRMITNRYVDPTPVRRFMQYVERSPAGLHVGAHAACGAARSVRRAHRRPARTRANRA
jgi:hypothetical protein